MFCRQRAGGGRELPDAMSLRYADTSLYYAVNEPLPYISFFKILVFMCNEKS